MGVGHGRVLKVGADDVYGQEVNAASKLGEDTARAHEILLTDAAKNAAGEVEGVAFEAMDKTVAGVVAVWRCRYAHVPGTP